MTKYRCLSHLLGHESGGSILSALKGRSWANALSSYVSPSLNDFAFFGVTIDLSEEGVNHVDEIVTCIFAYIGEYALNWIFPFH